jgi:hypothetical protein
MAQIAPVEFLLEIALAIGSTDHFIKMDWQKFQPAVRDLMARS